MFTCLKNFVYKADLLKLSFAPLFKNQKLSSTYFGSFYSLFILAVVTYFIATSNMLNKVNPYVIDQVLTTPHASLITWTPQNFEMAIGVADYLGKAYYDPTMFKIDIIQFHVSYNSTTKKMYYSYIDFKETTPCKPNNFSDPETFSSFGFDNYACLKNPNDTLEIEGGFDEQSLKAVAIMLTFCNNKTSNNTCKSQAAINKFVSDKGIWAYFQDTVYDVSNYQTPITKTWKLKITLIATVSRFSSIVFKKLDFLNDDNWLFASFNTTSGWIRESMEITSSWMKFGLVGTSRAHMVNNSISAILFYSSKNLQHCQRQYQKLGILIAEIGGIINILFILGKVICSALNEFKMQNLIFKNLYCFSSRPKMVFKDTTENFNKNNEILVSSLRMKDSQRNFKPEDGKPNFGVDILKLENCEKIEKGEKTELVSYLREKPSLNIFGYMFLGLKKASSRQLTINQKLYTIAERRFNTDTDVLNLVRALNKLEILKKVVFSKEQLNMFHLCAKPLIYLENQKEDLENSGYKMRASLMNLSLFRNQMKSEEKIQILKTFYQQLLNKQVLNTTERNILEILKEFYF